MDKITENRINLLHPKIKDEVKALVEKANSLLSAHSEIRIVQGLRTFEEQHKLFLQRPRVTKADAGSSYHNYGLAIDFCLLIDDKEISWDLQKDWDGDKIADWMEVVKVFKDAGYEWGGNWKFKDNPHFQKTFGYTWKQLLEKHKNKDFIPGTTFVNI